MKLKLFHKIDEASHENAEVRQFIVARELKKFIDFANASYESSGKELLAATGEITTPVLMLADGKTVSGKDAIIAWLEENGPSLHEVRRTI